MILLLLLLLVIIMDTSEKRAKLIVSQYCFNWLWSMKIRRGEMKQSKLEVNNLILLPDAAAAVASEDDSDDSGFLVKTNHLFAHLLLEPSKWAPILETFRHE